MGAEVEDVNMATYCENVVTLHWTSFINTFNDPSLGPCYVPYTPHHEVQHVRGEALTPESSVVRSEGDLSEVLSLPCL